MLFSPWRHAALCVASVAYINVPAPSTLAAPITIAQHGVVETPFSITTGPVDPSITNLATTQSSTTFDILPFLPTQGSSLTVQFSYHHLGRVTPVGSVGISMGITNTSSTTSNMSSDLEASFKFKANDTEFSSRRAFEDLRYLVAPGATKGDSTGIIFQALTFHTVNSSAFITSQPLDLKFTQQLDLSSPQNFAIATADGSIRTSWFLKYVFEPTPPPSKNVLLLGESSVNGTISTYSGDLWNNFRYGYDLDSLYPDHVAPWWALNSTDCFHCKGIGATFTPANGMTLAEAAAQLGYDHFNWYQAYTTDGGNSWNPDPPSAPLLQSAPSPLLVGSCYAYVAALREAASNPDALYDPGYCESTTAIPNRDLLPWYLDEQFTYDGFRVFDNAGNSVNSDPDARTRLQMWTQDPHTLLYNDGPNVDGIYKTCLAGVNKDGTGEVFDAPDSCFQFSVTNGAIIPVLVEGDGSPDIGSVTFLPQHHFTPQELQAMRAAGTDIAGATNQVPEPPVFTMFLLAAAVVPFLRKKRAPLCDGAAGGKMLLRPIGVIALMLGSLSAHAADFTPFVGLWEGHINNNRGSAVVQVSVEPSGTTSYWFQGNRQNMGAPELQAQALKVPFASGSGHILLTPIGNGMNFNYVGRQGDASTTLSKK